MPQGQQGEFFEEGIFHVRVLNVTVVNSRKGKRLYTVETEVTASDSLSQPAGTRCTAMIDLSNMDMRDKNMKTFLAAAMGYDPAQFPKDALPPVGGSWSNLGRETVGPRQPLKGLEMGLRAVTREKRDGSGEFTDLGWLPKALLPMGPVRPARTRAPEPMQQPAAAPQGWGPAPGAGAAGVWGAQPVQSRPQQGPTPPGWGQPSLHDNIPF